MECLLSLQWVLRSTILSLETWSFTYLIHDQSHHRIGSLLHVDDEPSEYLQWYIFDTVNEIENKKKALSRGSIMINHPCTLKYQQNVNIQWFYTSTTRSRRESDNNVNQWQQSLCSVSSRVFLPINVRTMRPLDTISSERILRNVVKSVWNWFK